jgi:hypothetical protein
MDHSERPSLELARARDAIEAMRNAKTVDELAEHWSTFLGRLQRVWNKAASHFSQSPKWIGWSGRFMHLRRTDPLLAYLVHARNAHEHTVQDIVTKVMGRIGIGPAQGNLLSIERMVAKDGNFFIKALQPIKVDFVPAKIMLAPVTDQGITYQPPNMHLNTPFDSVSAIAVAEAGARFYAQFLSEAENYFVSSTSPKK